MNPPPLPPPPQGGLFDQDLLEEIRALKEQIRRLTEEVSMMRAGQGLWYPYPPYSPSYPTPPFSPTYPGYPGTFPWTCGGDPNRPTAWSDRGTSLLDSKLD